jgi:hypothetical protein
MKEFLKFENEVIQVILQTASSRYEWWYHNALAWAPFGIGARGRDVMLDNNGGN